MPEETTGRRNRPKIFGCLGMPCLKGRAHVQAFLCQWKNTLVLVPNDWDFLSSVTTDTMLH